MRLRFGIERRRRILLPPYDGPAVHLFRGAWAGERRRRSYGLCWTTDKAEAEWHAAHKQQWPRGCVVLETLAPAAAIICAVQYGEPLTLEKIARQFPGTPASAAQELIDNHQDFSHEREHIVDRRHLNAVSVARRNAQRPLDDAGNPFSAANPSAA
jgi:hypothetical protein